MNLQQEKIEITKIMDVTKITRHHKDYRKCGMTEINKIAMVTKIANITKITKITDVTGITEIT